jgi:hypothetical protein
MNLDAAARSMRTRIASEEASGGNVKWVLRMFPQEVLACRQRTKKAKTLLIVVADADDNTVEARRRQCNDALSVAGYPLLQQSEPVALLIPRRHIETWIRCLLGEEVSEVENCKPHRPFTSQQMRTAAKTLYEWSRPNAQLGSTCVPSLTAALPEWRKLA